MRQMFFAEAPGPTDQKLTPHLRRTGAYLWRLYIGLTLAAAIALSVAGLPMYDAVCHAMTTLAAGGFSPHAQSIMGYNNAAAEWIICVFMFLAGARTSLFSIVRSWVDRAIVSRRRVPSLCRDCCGRRWLFDIVAVGRTR